MQDIIRGEEDPRKGCVTDFVFPSCAAFPFMLYSGYSEAGAQKCQRIKYSGIPAIKVASSSGLDSTKPFSNTIMHPLSKKPIIVDTLVIEKKDDVVIDEDIAAIFLRHNIFEYKNPSDALSIDEYYNLLACMCRYKATTGMTDAVKVGQITGTLIKDVKPVKAFKEIRALGGVVEKRYPGIYYISGLIHMPTQIIVQSELGKEMNAVLRIISKHAREEDIRQFIEETRSLSDADDKRNADAVYEVSMRANRALHE